MKKIISKIMLMFFTLGIIFGGVTKNVFADVNTERIYGNDRIETSVKISENGWQKGAESAVIAQAYGYADALCAGPLAKKYKGPILLSDKTSLNSSVINELKRLKVKKVFIVGGSGALSENLEKQLGKLGIKDIERLWGKDRYETSTKVAKRLGTVDNIVISSGNGYADSLSIAPIAAQKGMPILLSEKDKLSNEVNDYIKSLNIKNTYIVGGTGVISENIEKNVPNAKRLSGNDRFETNRVVISHFQNELNFNNIFIAQGDGPTGNEFADALSGSVLAAEKSSPVVLVYKNINSKTAEFIKTKMTKDTKLIALGGKSVVSDEILNALIDLFNGKKPSTGIETPSTSGSSSGGGGSSSSNKDTFTLTITKNNGSETIKTETLKADSSKNAMDHLKSIAKVAELQQVGSGFINGIDGLINVPLKDMSIEKRKQGIYGVDWFIRLNGKLTNVGSLGVYPEAGDTLNFDYHEWDWHSLVPDDYTGSMPMQIKIKDPKDMKNPKDMKDIYVGTPIIVEATCVYRPVYDAVVKVDGKEVKTTDIDGYAPITLNTSGTHKVSVEKEGGIATKSINVKSNGSGGVTPPEEKDLKLNSPNSSYDGDSSNNEKYFKDVKISADNITLKNVNVSGELIVDPGIKGISNIENVTASKIIVKSGAVDSIHFKNVKSDSLLINSNSYVRVEAKEDTQIKNTEVVTSTVLEPINSSFGKVTMVGNGIEASNLELRGDFKDVVDIKANAKVVAKTDNPIPQINVVSDSKVQLTVEGKFENIKVDKEANIIAENNTEISKIEANDSINIKLNGENSNVKTVEKGKDVKVTGDIDKTEIKEKSDKPDEPKPDEPKDDKDTFKLIISRDNGSSTLKDVHIKVEEGKSAMDYLKSISQVTELQGPGFINGIDGLLYVRMEDLSIEKREQGILGIDWFIRLNGKFTDKGATGVYPKAGDTLNFDYHEWDWHSLVSPDYTGNMPIQIIGIPYKDIYVGDSIKIQGLCVYRPIYNAVVKVDGQQVATTDLDGYATITLNTSGTHEISVEKEGGVAKRSINVKGGGITPPKPVDKKLVDIKSPIIFTITKTSIGVLNIDANSNKDDDYITVTLYDEVGNMAYINQSSNGKMNLSTILKNGKYHGFVKASSTEKIEISEFEVK